MNLLTKFLLALGVLLVLVVLFGLFFFRQTRNYFLDSLAENNQLINDQILENIDHILFERYLDIWTISENQTIQEYLSSPNGTDTETLENTIKTYSVTTGPWKYIDILNKDGEIIFSSKNSRIGMDLSDLSHIKTGVEVASEDNIYYSDALKIEQNEPSLIYIAPVKSGSLAGKPLVGYVQVEIPWELVMEQIDNVPKDINMYLFNSNKEIIGSNNKEISYFSKLNKNLEFNNNLTPGIVDSNSKYLKIKSDQKGRLGYKGSSWFLISEIPSFKVFSDVNQASLRLLFSFAIFSISFFIFISFIFNKYFINPLRSLTKTVKKISEGNLDKRSSIKSKDEIGVLAKSFNDMTDKLIFESQQARQNELRLKTSIRDLPIGFILVNTKAEIVMSNLNSNSKLFNIANDVWTFDEFNKLNNLDFNWTENILNSIKNKKIILVKEARYQTEKYMKIEIVPVYDEQNNQVVNAVVLVDDITEEIQLSKTRDEFFALASHELRTPLTSIRGNASMIEEHFSEKIKDQDLKEMINDIYESSVTLISIVEDFLDVSRLEQNRLDFVYSKVNTKEIIDSVMSQLIPLAKDKRIELVYKANMNYEIYADKKKTEQILINLVSNSIKFTGVNGKIEVSLLEEEPFIRFKVKDTGRGIPKQNQSKLFQKFSQTGENPLTRDATQGTGLGLYISKLLIQGMGGKIFLEESVVGKGSTFSFLIPKYFPGIENKVNIS